jgi:hypothetical protein
MNQVPHISKKVLLLSRVLYRTKNWKGSSSKGIADTTKKSIKELIFIRICPRLFRSIGAHASRRLPKNGPWKNLGASPYNNRLEQSARGRHLLCSGGSVRVGLTAKQLPVPSGPSASQAGHRPCSQLNRALYGRNEG